MSNNDAGPGFVTYTRDTFKELERQLNIMVLVGNGFDIQVLREYERPVDSRYEPFYHHLRMRDFDPENLLLKHMEEELKGGRENWSDVEAAVGAAVVAGDQEPGDIFGALRALQSEFAEFLQGVVPSELLGELGKDAVTHRWSWGSLSNFLYDIEDQDGFRSMEFPDKAGDHYRLLNFLFVNFNYTTLLDNYLYLDQIQFTPRQHRGVDTNFWFRHDPRGHLVANNAGDFGQSGYVLTDVVHPHGVLSTPRSLLFGIDAPDDYDRTKSASNQLRKPYWAQANVRYRSHFAQTDLFIVFGCSLGSSDGWWWRSIAQALKVGRAELVIYRRQDSDGHTPESMRTRFLKVAEVDDRDRDAVSARIFVVVYEDTSDRVFLNTRRPESHKD